MDNHTLKQWQAAAEKAARAAGEIIRRDYGKPRNVREKDGPRDLVTDTDHAAQEAALAVIRAGWPEHYIIAEEDAGDLEDERGIWPIPDGVVWAVDPVDGTTNFTTGLPMTSVSVGAALNGNPLVGAIFDPLRDEMLLGAKGQGMTLNGKAVPPLEAVSLESSVLSVDWAHAPGMRERVIASVTKLAPHCRTLRALGSAALGLGYVALGRVQTYTNFGLKPWDICAGAVLIGEVGGELRNPDGSAWQFGEPWLMAGHPALLDEIQGILGIS